MSGITLHEIAAALGGDLLGEGGLCVTRIGPLEGADAGTISFLANPLYQSQLAASQAACVIVKPDSAEAAQARNEGRGAAIVTPDPYLYFARLTQWWASRTRPLPTAAIHPSAVIAPDAVLGEGVDVGPLAVIESGAQIGAHARIGAHCTIGANAQVGAHTRLSAHVSLGFDCRIGERCIVHSGVVIGADGFGFAPNRGEWEKIEQLGAVTIGDAVEIGANTCIDRGALDDTLIGNGVKLDNLIQIGHNVRIGDHTIIAAFTGIAGSAVIGKHCMIGGAARIQGHIEICDRVQVSTCTFISRSIRTPGNYSGAYPFEENVSWEKNAATLRQLHRLRDRIRALESKTKSCLTQAAPASEDQNSDPS